MFYKFTNYKFSAFDRFTRATHLFILGNLFFLIVDISDTVHQNQYQNVCPDPIR